MNGQYNRPVTLTDFLYLIVLYLGISSILSFYNWQVYVFYIIITLSLIVDWTSAFTMSPQGSAKLLLSDIFTSLNYLCLYQALTHLDLSLAGTYVRYFFHYGTVFTIYSIWNVILLKSNDATQATAKFLIAYTVAGIIFAGCCFCSFAMGLCNLIPSNICLVIAWIICMIHFCELLLWLKDTFVNEHHE